MDKFNVVKNSLAFSLGLPESVFGGFQINIEIVPLANLLIDRRLLCFSIFFSVEVGIDALFIRVLPLIPFVSLIIRFTIVVTN